MARMTLEQVKAANPRVDRNRIEATTEADIHRQMIEDGEDPDAPLPVFVEEVPPAVARKSLGLTQEGFAALLGVPVGTLRNWEQERVTMDPAARALMRMVRTFPAAFVRERDRLTVVGRTILSLVDQLESDHAVTKRIEQQHIAEIKRAAIAILKLSGPEDEHDTSRDAGAKPGGKTRREPSRA